MNLAIGGERATQLGAGSDLRRLISEVQSGSSSKTTSHQLPSRIPLISTTAPTFQPPKGRDGALLTLGVYIQAVNLAMDTCDVSPAQLMSASPQLRPNAATTLWVNYRGTRGTPQVCWALRDRPGNHRTC